MSGGRPSIWCVDVYMYMYVDVLCMYELMYIYIYVCMYVWMFVCLDVRYAIFLVRRRRFEDLSTREACTSGATACSQSRISQIKRALLL